MTLQQALDMALRRVGLEVTETDHKDQARLYANMVAKEIIGEAKWWWTFRTATLRTTRRLTVTSPAPGSAYTVGETVTDGQASPYSTTVDSWDSTNNYLYVYSENSVTPTGTLTGGSSGMTSTYSTREYTRTYLLSSDVGSLHWFVNESGGEGTYLEIVGSEEYMMRDPDRDDTGDPRLVCVEGLDAEQDTGQIVVSVVPRDSTTNDTLRYAYTLFLTDWTSSNDSTDLARWIHPLVQPALVYGIEKMYMQEEGNDDGARIAQGEYNKVIQKARDQNLQIWGNRSWRRRGNIGLVDSRNKRFDFWVHEGTLTA